MVGVGNGAQRHGRGKQTKCCALPRPPSCQKWCKQALPPADGDETGSSLFGKTEVISHDRLKGACRGESPSAALFFQSFSGGRKALASPEVKAEKIDIFQEHTEFLPCGRKKLKM